MTVTTSLPYLSADSMASAKRRRLSLSSKSMPARNPVDNKINVVRLVPLSSMRVRSDGICRRCGLRKIRRSKNHRASGNTPLSGRARPAQESKYFRRPPSSCLSLRAGRRAVLRHVDHDVNDFLIRQFLDFAAAGGAKRFSGRAKRTRR